MHEVDKTISAATVRDVSNGSKIHSLSSAEAQVVRHSSDKLNPDANEVHHIVSNSDANTIRNANEVRHLDANSISNANSVASSRAYRTRTRFTFQMLSRMQMSQVHPPGHFTKHLQDFRFSVTHLTLMRLI